MTRSTRLTAALVFAMVAIPALPADAQVYPERIRSVTRAVSATVHSERFQRANQRESQTERITKTVRIGAGAEIEISNIAGDITVTRGSGDAVAIEAIKTARGASVEDAKEALALVTVQIVERAGRVEIKTEYPRGDDLRRRNRRNINVTVAFTLTAPERARVSVNTVSGSISVKDIKGDLALETISGNVSVANANRVSKVSSTSGNVEVVDTTVEGMMEASSISGTVLLRHVKAQQLDLGSISGHVVIENVSCDRVDAQSISGDVKLSGPLTRGARYDLGSHSGEVNVVISGDVGFELEASSFSGGVRADLPIKIVETATRGNRRSQRAIRGTYGDGSAILDLTTFSGSVVIAKR